MNKGVAAGSGAVFFRTRSHRTDIAQVELRTGHQRGVAKQDGLLVYPLDSCLEQCGLLAGPSILVETFSEIYCLVPAGFGLWEGKKCPV